MKSSNSSVIKGCWKVMKNWITAIRKWWIAPNGRKDAITSALFFGVFFFVVSKIFDRDLSYLWMVGATGFTLVVIAAATLRIASKRAGYSFSHSLLVIFTLMVPLATYRWTFVALGRPGWMFDGLPFDIFIGCSGGVLGAMLQYLRTIGHMRQESLKYKILFWLIIVITLMISAVVYK